MQRRVWRWLGLAFALAAMLGCEHADHEEVVAVTSQALTLNPNLILTVTTPFQNVIQLAWTDIPGETAYNIDRSTNGANQFSQVKVQPANSISWIDDVSKPALTGFCYRIRPVGLADPVSNTVCVTTPAGYETDIQTRIVSTGDTMTVVNDGNASGGKVLVANLNAAGDFVEYSLNVGATGLYDAKVRYLTGADRGIFQVKIDGVNQGAPIDGYSATPQYREVSLGALDVRIPSTQKKFRFQVTGKNPASTSNKVAVDVVSLHALAIRYEAETSSPAVSTQDNQNSVLDAAASGGKVNIGTFNALNDFVRYTLAVAAPGRFQISARYRTGPDRGKFQVKLDGTVALGTELEGYAPAAGFVTSILGAAAIIPAGNHTVTFAVTGKATASSGFGITVDYVEIRSMTFPSPPPSNPTLVDPETASPSAAALSQYLAATAASPPSGTSPAGSPQGAPASVPFIFRVTSVHVADPSTFDTPAPEIKIDIDGVRVADFFPACRDQVNMGCVIPGDNTYPLDRPFTKMLAPGQTTVSMHIEVWDEDLFSGDDLEHTINLTIDPRTGTWMGTVASPTNCSNGNGFGICWDLPFSRTVGVCATLRAQFIDGGYGEDFDNTSAPAQVPARFMQGQFFLPDGTTFPPDVATGAFATLDQNGCVLGLPAASFALPASAPTGTLQVNLRSKLVAGPVTWNVWTVPPQVRTVMPAPGGGCVAGSTSTTAKAAARSLGTFSTGVALPGTGPAWEVRDGWLLPPPIIVANDSDIGAVGNSESVDVARVAVVAGQMLATSDHGMEPGVYDANADDACPTGDVRILGDSCATSNELWIGIGKGCPVDRPSQSAWKFIVAHEAGHLIQQRGMGVVQNLYDFMDAGGQVLPDPPGTPLLCQCSQVTVANQLHCLQSLERSSAAQAEGFAQFYASKTWNAPTEDECRFNYYKEFLAETCLPGTKQCSPSATAPLVVNAPPIPVSCKQPKRWRNNHCPMVSDFATEFDWMGFYFNLNTSGLNHLFMPEIYDLYATACNGSCQFVSVSWEGCLDPNPAVCPTQDRSFRTAAEQFLSGNQALLNNLLQKGDEFGVSRSLQP